MFFTKEIQVNALSKNEILPAVNIPELGEERRINLSDAFASLLRGLEVMAVVFFCNFGNLDVCNSVSRDRYKVDML